jgi:hypothetical protein
VVVFFGAVQGLRGWLLGSGSKYVVVLEVLVCCLGDTITISTLFSSNVDIGIPYWVLDIINPGADPGKSV